MSSTSTGRQIRQEVGRILTAREDPKLPVYMDFVNSGTSSSQITDAIRLGSTRFTGQKFQDYYIRGSDTSGAVPDGDKLYARTLTPSTGVLTHSPDASAAWAANDTGELWRPDTDPDDLDRNRDRALTQLTTRWRLTPLSWALNADFLTDALANTTPTSWTASSANLEVTNRSGMERFSERVLKVTSTSGAGYAGQSINAPDGAGSGGEAQTWMFSCLVQSDVGTATPVIFDVTNSAALTLSAISRTTWAGEAFQRLSFTFQTLATTEVISARLGVSATSDISYYGPISVYPVNATEFVLPARIVNKTYVGKWYEMTGNDWPEDQMYEIQAPRMLDVGGGYVRVVFDRPVGTRAIYFEEFANYGALQATYHTPAGRIVGDAATTDCPLEYASWATLHMAYPGRFEDEWMRARRRHSARRQVRVERPAVYA